MNKDNLNYNIVARLVGISLIVPAIVPHAVLNYENWVNFSSISLGALFLLLFISWFVG